jgi:hypothetical protein
MVLVFLVLCYVFQSAAVVFTVSPKMISFLVELWIFLDVAFSRSAACFLRAYMVPVCPEPEQLATRATISHASIQNQALGSSSVSRGSRVELPWGNLCSWISNSQWRLVCFKPASQLLNVLRSRCSSAAQPRRFTKLTTIIAARSPR